MANKCNDWHTLLKLANIDIAPYGYKINAYKSDEYEDFWTVDIDREGDPTKDFAENYNEWELSDCINDAWAHVRAKIKGEKKIYYTATALYNNDENHSAEMG